MAKGRGDFTDILVKKQVLSADQLSEARNMAQQTGAKIQDTIVKLGYCSLDEVMKAVGEHSGMQSVSLVDVTIPPSVIELVPESVARENVVIPLSQENGTLKIDRKSTRLNSSHVSISYAVFCLKKKSFRD